MRLTQRKYLVWLVAALAVLVHLPALSAPLVFDDYAQSAIAEGRFGVRRGPLDLYDYIDDGDRDVLLARGDLPWWTDPQLTVRFLRPLASALRWADIRLFGQRLLWHHAHSLLWWGLAVAGVHGLLRRSFHSRAALMGATVFALAVCHAVPLVWLANRVALVSLAIGAFALTAYLRWRETRRACDALVSLALFALAFLAGEYTLCFAGYVLAIEVARWREPLSRRVSGTAPFALPAVAFVAAHAWLGYGAHGAGFYRSPLHDFAAFAARAPRRLAVLGATAWAGVDESWSQSPGWALAGLAAACIGVLALPVARVVRGLDQPQRTHATWMLFGSVLALLPVLAVEASARLLGVAMIGVSGVVALLLDRSWFPAQRESRRGAAELSGLVALALGFVHLVRAPLDTMLVSLQVSREGARYAERLGWVRDHADTRGSTIFVLRASSAEALLWGRLALDGAAPARWRVLTFGSGRSLLLRKGPRTIELVAAPRPLIGVGSDDLFRNAGALKPGDAVQVPGLRATVLKLDDQRRPSHVSFELDEDIDSPDLQWLAEGESGFREERPPAVGYGAPLDP
jgi:hypothetical protein